MFKCLLLQQSEKYMLGTDCHRCKRRLLFFVYTNVGSDLYGHPGASFTHSVSRHFNECNIAGHV